MDTGDCDAAAGSAVGAEPRVDAGGKRAP